MRCFPRWPEDAGESRGLPLGLGERLGALRSRDALGAVPRTHPPVARLSSRSAGPPPIAVDSAVDPGARVLAFGGLRPASSVLEPLPVGRKRKRCDDDDDDEQDFLGGVDDERRGPARSWAATPASLPARSGVWQRCARRSTGWRLKSPTRATALLNSAMPSGTPRTRCAHCRTPSAASSARSRAPSVSARSRCFLHSPGREHPRERRAWDSAAVERPAATPWGGAAPGDASSRRAALMRGAAPRRALSLSARPNGAGDGPPRRRGRSPHSAPAGDGVSGSGVAADALVHPHRVTTVPPRVRHARDGHRPVSARRVLVGGGHARTAPRGSSPRWGPLGRGEVDEAHGGRRHTRTTPHPPRATTQKFSGGSGCLRAAWRRGGI